MHLEVKFNQDKTLWHNEIPILRPSRLVSQDISYLNSLSAQIHITLMINQKLFLMFYSLTSSTFNEQKGFNKCLVDDFKVTG